jgi:HTH-type transcriptional regulator/antitoxin HigA
MGKQMAVTEISPTKYGRLLAETLPKVIETREEFDRAVTLMEELDFREATTGIPLEPEEEALRALLEKLIKDYDDQIELPKTTPDHMIRFLMEHRGLKQADLLPIFGSLGVASDVINGKREPSKAHIRKLAEFFRLPADLFL